MEYARIERFRSDRVAQKKKKPFAELYGGEYHGWIDDPSTFTIKKCGEEITQNYDGAYVVTWKENENGKSCKLRCSF